MSKPSIPKILMPAVWVLTLAIASVALLVGSSHLRSRNASAAKPAGTPQAPALNAAEHSRIRASFEALPLSFEANQGQTDPRVKYIARGSGYTVFLTGNETVFAVSSMHESSAAFKHGLHAASKQNADVPRTAAAIHMKLLGGNRTPELVADDELPGRSNYYVGNDPSKWQKDVKHYADVSYREVYPGVDMKFHGEQRQLEFDFMVAAGANAAPIRFGVTGAQRITTDDSGNLVLSSAAGDVLLHKPVAYQEKDSTREAVAARFVVKAKNIVGFELGSYDPTRELVIDPSVSYATYLGGGSEDEAFGIALDGSGNTYITGQADSLSFNGQAAGPRFNVFITKLKSDGSQFVYTDILAATGSGARCSAGGTGDCSGNAIAVDGSGNAYVAGTATSGFPVLSAFQTLFGGGTSDAFVAKVNSSGALVYSTYLGGSGQDIANAIAVDGSGNVYVAGDTFSTDFPTVSPIQGSNKGADDAFITKLNANGSSLGYSTYIGGSSGDLATGIALDGSNNAYVSMIVSSTDVTTSAGAYKATAPGGGGDGFVVQVMSNGSEGYATYLGGSGVDNLFAVAVDSAGEAYVTGNTVSSDYPTVNAAQSTLKGASDVVITKLNATGSGLVFSTYLGGTLDESASGVALDTFGDAYIIGGTISSDFPTSGQAFQTALSGTSDAFVAELSNTGFVVYSSYLGGTGIENSLPGTGSPGTIGAVAVDSTSNAYVAGNTSSTTGFPTTSGAAQGAYGGGLSDGFVAKVGPAPADFSVSISPATTSVSSGGTTSQITVTVSSVNASFGQAVTLSCGGVPAKSACNFSAASVTPGSTAVTSDLTINTNSSSSASLLMPGPNHHLEVFASLLLPVLGIAVIGGGIGPRRKRLFGLALLGVVLLALLMLPACGGSSGGGGGGGGGGTTPGTYNLTVSGAAGGVTHSVPLTLTVN